MSTNCCHVSLTKWYFYWLISWSIFKIIKKTVETTFTYWDDFSGVNKQLPWQHFCWKYLLQFVSNFFTRLDLNNNFDHNFGEVEFENLYRIDFWFSLLSLTALTLHTALLITSFFYWLKATFQLTISMRGERATGKIQRNNYHHGNWGPSLPGKTMSVFVIFTQGTHRNVKNRWMRSSLKPGFH